MATGRTVLFTTEPELAQGVSNSKRHSSRKSSLSRHVRRTQRSRSSPRRLSLSGINSSDVRGRSPSTSALRVNLHSTPVPAVLSPHSTLHNYGSNATGAVAFYSPCPPSTPLYLVPLPPTPGALSTTVHTFKCSEQQTEIKNKESGRIVRCMMRLILQGVANAARAGPRALTDVPCALSVKAIYHSVASQTDSQSVVKRQHTLEIEDELSSSSDGGVEDMCGIVGDLRALRDSHVRLVLRQLRQLRDVERLNRTLRRGRVSTHLQSNSPRSKAAYAAQPTCL